MQRTKTHGDSSSAASAPLPRLLTADETALVIRTSRAAVYALYERGRLPGAIRIGRRLLFDERTLVDWLNQKRAPSPKE